MDTIIGRAGGFDSTIAGGPSRSSARRCSMTWLFTKDRASYWFTVTMMSKTIPRSHRYRRCVSHSCKHYGLSPASSALSSSARGTSASVTTKILGQAVSCVGSFITQLLEKCPSAGPDTLDPDISLSEIEKGDPEHLTKLFAALVHQPQRRSS
ncbi:hypothetical protein GGR54DRAFT_338823 [Hypoxylon sp. NC1633]|nr:hypothetical protein GGR54DRAFT_338823 [Hypoxylon sp. NC1633]